MKQFNIEDDMSTMKVSTDSVLLGCLTKISSTPKYILDIGTGCGILALMMAQRYDESYIDAIDIDSDSIYQAKLNFQSSPWSKRLNAIKIPLLQRNPPYKYDLIITNPPYFSNSLKNDDERKKKARHDETLTLADIFSFCKNHLSDHGCVSIILPSERAEECKAIAARFFLHPQMITTIHNKPNTVAKRTILSLCFNSNTNISSIETNDFYLREEETNAYSSQYTEATSEFLL